MSVASDKKLTQRYGEFERATFEYTAMTPGFAAWVKKLTRRRGEVILIVPRGNGNVLLHTKPHYPDDVYRLPTGGIHPEEEAGRAARRESYEEIGYKPDELRLLGILDNVFTVGSKSYTYPSYVFRTPEYLSTPEPTDSDELISGFRDGDADELRAIGLYLNSLPGSWREWGRFRATSHLWVADRLDKL